MSIEKYLESVRLPNTQPGPYSVKLKYDLKSKFVAKQRRKSVYLTGFSFASVTLLVFLSLIVYKPEIAISLHHAVLNNTEMINNENLSEEQLIAEQRQAEIELPYEGNYLGRQYQVSSSTHPAEVPFRIMELSQLEDETPYIIRKVKDSNDRHIYFISEVNSSERTLY